MDRYSRRERLGLVAIAIAALASAATGALPPPTPHLTSSDKGTIRLTAADPIAWLDVSATDNQALRTAGGRTTVRIQAQAARDQGVLLIASDLGPHGSTSNSTRSVSSQSSCDVGQDCRPTVRLMAVLLDPAAHPAAEEVGWTATAETRFPEGPVPAATMAVDVRAVESRAAAALGIGSTKPETIELGPDVPRVVRLVRLTLPEGPAAASPLNPGAFLRTRADGDGAPGFQPPATIRVIDGPTVNSIDRLSHLLTPIAGCDAGAPCEVNLRIEFDWNGGSAEGSSLEWTLAAWSGVTKGGPTQPPAIVVTAADVQWGHPTLTASTTGQTVVVGRGGARVRVAPRLDLIDVPQGVAELKGLFRLTLRAALAPGGDPAADIGVAAGGGRATEGLRPGQPVVVYSQVQEAVCRGRTARCGEAVSFEIVLFRDSSEQPDATVDWTAEVEFLPLTQDEVPAGSKLRIEVEALTR